MHGFLGATAQLPHDGASRLLWARYYASRGWLVLPLYSVEGGRCTCGDATCRSPGNHPRTPVKDASAHSFHINRWWRWWPSSNVSIAIGVASGLVVLDIDWQNGGDASFAQLQSKLPDAFKEPLEV